MARLLSYFRDVNFMPHGHCFLWTPDVLWLNVVSDSIIATAYYSIPLALYYLVRKRGDIQYHWILLMFALFILACGTTHIMEVWNIWHADYRLAGFIKAFTAGVSLVTAACLWPLIPKLLALPSPSQLSHVNADLRLQITEREKAETALRALNIELERRVEQRTAEVRRSNQDLEHFAYVASHDLQQPLRTVSNMVQLIDKRLSEQLDVETREFLQLAREASTRAQLLIKDLLTYSRLSTAPSRKTIVDMAEVFEVTCRDLKAVLQETAAKVSHDPLPSVHAEWALLVQLFQNLIGNAVKYRSAAAPEIHVSARETEREWIFSIRDNGIGIDPQYHERIFEMFKRLHTVSEYPGSGMGLSICKRIVQRWNGKIWVESALGAGSTFYFSIPHETIAEDAEKPAIN